MTEVPEHLLRRSAERKAQMTGQPAGGTEAPATEAAAASSAVEPAGPAPAASGGGAPAKPAEPTFTGPPQPPEPKRRIPMWAMPVVAALPFWALLYSGAFGERHTGEPTILERGATVYANCATCHGATGGGGVGPALDRVLEQFPDFDDHVTWVKEGSLAVKGGPYGALGTIATGGMPAFEASLSDEEIVAVVCHERVTIAGGEIPEQCEEGGSTEGGETEEGAEGETENEDASGH